MGGKVSYLLAERYAHRQVFCDSSQKIPAPGLWSFFGYFLCLKPEKPSHTISTVHVYICIIYVLDTFLLLIVQISGVLLTFPYDIEQGITNAWRKTDDTENSAKGTPLEAHILSYAGTEHSFHLGRP